MNKILQMEKNNKINFGKKFSEQILVDSKSKKDSTPFDLINSWDFGVLFICIILRFVIAARVKATKLELKGKTFQFYKYFDSIHIVRWATHSLTAIVGLMIFPEIFVNYIQPKFVPEMEDWTLFGSGFIGFLGYDIIRGIEKIMFTVLGKTGVKMDE